ncbi:M28 family peptidase [Dactylosporangium sp. NPDC051484]|uniref:M28 family peptidase n=1 Tax=Dactylosporangium sp. NPDC051484 TaxID=3154942 RepID=UPI00344CC2DE
MSRPADPVVAYLLDAVRTAEMLADVERLATYDRYQASQGLARAADLVAASAESAGVTGVDIQWYPADGAAHWWTFRSPVAWTPIHASLRLSGPGGGSVDIDHDTEPFSVATYSAPTAPEGTVAPLVRHGCGAPLGGAVVVLERATYLEGDVLTTLAEAGALGFVTDTPWRDDAGTARRGRIELPPDTGLAAFSLTPAELDVARALADAGGTARVRISVDRSAAMPVVSGLLPGTDQGLDEIWLTAHLCHPRPSANDNASGVAAALGAAAALRRAQRDGPRWQNTRGIRLFWGPEFLGMAATLHANRGGRLPGAVLNLDMVGEDQTRCESPFVLERPPDCHPSLLAPLAEHVVGAVFAATAVPRGGTWRTAEFDGFSDHALFADPSVRRPAVQFCHPADRFNHSAADTPDKVSALEMLRSATAAAALAHLAAGPGIPGSALPDAVERWCRAQRTEADRIAAGQDERWGAGLRAHVAQTTAAVRALLRSAPLTQKPPSAAAQGAVPQRPLRADWAGPLNLRAMQQSLPDGTRSRLAGLIAADKSWLSVLFNLAIRADGSTDRRTLVEKTSFGLRRPLDPEPTDLLLDALLESGWVTESPITQGASPFPSPTTRTAN